VTREDKTRCGLCTTVYPEIASRDREATAPRETSRTTPHTPHPTTPPPPRCSKNRSSRPLNSILPSTNPPPLRITTPQKSKLKSSIQRNLRQKLLDQFPLLAPHIDEILPKKSQLDLIKLPEKLSLYALDNRVLFFQHFDDALIPHLRLVHAYPHAFPRIQVDRGAIRFVLAGAQLMCPGLTSPGAQLPDAAEEIKPGQVVAVGAEGKENACMVGVLKMGTEEIKKINKGVAVEAGHYLGDGLWKFELSD
jgi:PUA domain protein